MLLMAVALFFSLFYKKKRIWLIAERGVDARDNGYVFFKYLRKEHPEIEAYYVISNESLDRERLKAYENSLVDYRTFRHYVLLWRAEVLVSTHLHGYFPYGGLGVWIHSILPFYRKKIHVMLQHGITKDYMSYLDYLNAPIDLMITAIRPEYDYFISAYHYPKQAVALTGFCRFDQLKNNTAKRQILVMPTWREWLYKKEAFFASEYLQTYIHLLQNQTLHEMLEKSNVDLVFNPHHEVQKYISYFKEKCTNSRIIIADKQNYDVQELLKSSALLVTDYSSVFFDFVYMQKPVIYYQFDRKRFRREHYADGWYDYDQGLGPCIHTEEECVEMVKEYILTDFAVESIYHDRADAMFISHDTNNCKRVYDAINDAMNKKEARLERASEHK